MELPYLCQCGTTVMVDWQNLERRLLSKLYTVEGYTCPSCTNWKPLFYSTLQMEDNFKRLSEMKPTHASFFWHFAKTRKRAEEIQKRGRITHGEIRI